MRGAPVRFDPLGGLVAEVGRGDRAAADTLVRALAPRAHRIAWRMLRDPVEAEDVTQEAMMRIWTTAASWRPGAALFETWLVRVVTNLCLDRLRRSGRFVEEGAAPEPADPDPGADVVLASGDVRARVDAALSALPDRQRAAVVLTHFEERSAAEAGDALGVSVEAIESLLARARRSLRAALADDGSDMIAALAAAGAGGAR